jgi:fatty-acid peroxygenase
MRTIPTDNAIDSTLGLALDGYMYISQRCDWLNSDIFQTKLLFQKTICMRGEEAAQLFNNNELIMREGATPSFVQKTLFGEGGVQGLDGQAHIHRKKMFMSLMSKDGIENLMRIMIKYWNQYLEKWESMEEVVLFNEASELIMESVCEWCGVPLLGKADVKQRTEEMSYLIEGAGSLGYRHWKGRASRNNAENWIKNLILKIRTGEMEASDDSALKKVALYDELDGELLSPQIAAVELINIIRPTVAVGRFITFMAVALRKYPQYKEKIKKDENYLEYFVQEVRRYYPFFPFAAAKTKKEFEWNGYYFPANTKIILDLFGTNRHPKLWEDPDEFKPERFKTWNQSPFNFIPQGGGNHSTNHRCPGEWITIEAMKVALKFMVSTMQYDVPEQDLSINLRRMPAIPESRFKMTNVKKTGEKGLKHEYKYARAESANS